MSLYIFSCTKFLNSNGKILDGTSKDSLAKAKSLFTCSINLKYKCSSSACEIKASIFAGGLYIFKFNYKFKNQIQTQRSIPITSFKFEF